MGKRDERYHLTGSVELDEGFFTVELQEEEKNKSLLKKRSDTSICRSYPIWGRRQLPRLSKSDWTRQ